MFHVEHFYGKIRGPQPNTPECRFFPTSIVTTMFLIETNPINRGLITTSDREPLLITLLSWSLGGRGARRGLLRRRLLEGLLRSALRLGGLRRRIGWSGFRCWRRLY